MNIESEIQELEKSVCCKICGGILERSPSGAVCEKLHGKIVPRPNPKSVRRYRKLKALVGLPNAEPFMGMKSYFTVDGLGGKYGYWAKTQSHIRGAEKVRYKDRVIWVAQIRSARVDSKIRKAKAEASR